MKVEKICIIFMLLLLFVFIGNVAANPEIDVDSISECDNSSIQSISAQNDIIMSSNEDLMEDSGEIEVSDWDDLRYYCSLSDRNYNLKLKENTNYYPTDPTSDDYQIVVKNNVTITGSLGAYIGDSSSNSRAISYTPIKVLDKSGIGITLNGITFKWISTSYQTDGIFMSLGGNVANTIRDCTFSNIVTNMGHSSIVHIKYGDLDIVNSSFTNCTTDFGCISVFCPDDDSTKICTGARMTVRDSYFSDNYAKTEPGCINNCGVLKVYNTTFYRNSAFWWAGAIHTHGGGNTSLYNSKFIDNVAGWNGGALYTYSFLQIYNSTFIGNNCTTDNGGGAIGACRYLHSPYIYIENSLFKDNANNCWGPDSLSSGSGRGGAISLMDEGGIDVRNTTFIHNSASKGSAIAIISQGANGSPDVRITNNTFIDNTKTGDVLYIYLSKSSKCEISNNNFINSTIEISKLRIAAEDPVNDEIVINIDTTLKNPAAYDSDILDKLDYNIYVDGVFYKKILGNKFVYSFMDDEKHDIYIVPSISSDVSNTISVSNKKQYIFLSKKYGNDNNDGLNRTSPVATLTKAIELANATGNIHVLDGTFSETNLTISYDVVIVGESDVVFNGVGDNLFTITSSSVTFRNIIFSNIMQTNKNSRVISTNGLLILEDCRFVGGVYYNAIDANEIHLSNIAFDSLEYKYYLINAPMLSADNISVTNNRFSGSVSDKGFLYSNSINRWNILNSKFENNVDLRSGLVYIKGNSLSQVNIKNAIFNSNKQLNSKSTAYTSCIFVSANLNVDSCVFVNNENVYNSSSPRSSLIFVDDKFNIEINNSIFVNNTYGSGAKGIIRVSDSNANAIKLGYNWYGNTLDDIAIQPALNPKINYAAWYSMNVSSSMDKLGPGEKAVITFDLHNIVLKNGTVLAYESFSLPEIKLILVATKGELSCDEITFDNGMAQVEFTKIGYDNSQIVASYYSCKGVVDIIGTKNTPDLEIETSDITAGDDLNVTVRISDDATGVTVLSFDGMNYTLTFADGVATKIISNVHDGNYTISVNYSGDSKYLERTITDSITVKRLDSSISIDVEDTYVGNDLKVTVTAFEGIKGNITLLIDNQVLSEKIIDGKAVFTISGLKANNYAVTASYPGNIRYASCEEKTNVSILKYDSNIKISLSEILLNADLTITANVLDDMSGNVTFIVNGESQIVNISSGKAIFTLTVFKGDYLIEAIYNGDDKYLTSRDSVEFSIGKVNSTLDVNVNDYDYGQNVTVVLTLNSDATGNVSVIIDNNEHIEKIKDGKATFVLSGLTAGDKNITAVYCGDGNYLASSNLAVFKIHKINPAINIIADSVMVGNDVVVKINFNNDMRGNFTIKIGEDTYLRGISKFGQLNDLIVSNLKPDDYDVIVTYSGDNNYESDLNATAFSVFEYPHPQVSNDGEDAQNTHKSPHQTISNGKVLFEIELVNNISGSIVVDEKGNIYFSSNDSILSYDSNGQIVWKFTSSGVDSVFSGVTIGRGMIIAPKVGDRLFFINQTSGLENMHSNMYWASSLFSPVIDEDFNVYVVSEYQYNDNIYRLVVIPYNLWETSLEPILIDLGNIEPISAPVVQNGLAVIPNKEGLYIVDISNNERANIKMNNNVRPIFGLENTIYVFNENKVVAINDQQILWQTAVTGGVGNALALDGDIGYLYSVNKQGRLFRYDILNGEESFLYDFEDDISSDILIDNDGNLYLGTESGIFYALDNNGNVLWRVDLNAPITGKPVMDEKGIIYVAANNSKIICLGNGEQIDPKLDVRANNVTVGEDVILNITFDKMALGEVSIYVENNLYNVLSSGNDGNLIVNISDLSYGNYSVEIRYSGDVRFKESSVKMNISVLKDTIDVDNNTFIIPDVIDASPSFSINLPDDAVGNLTVYLDGKIYKTVGLVEGKATIDVADLSFGNHDISIVYSGDNKYSSISKNITINVPEPHVQVIKIEGHDISMLYTSGAKYQVRLTSDGVGLSGKTVIFTVNGKQSKGVTDKNGFASVKIDLPPNSVKYLVTASYGNVKVSNKVKVNGIVSAKNLKAKKSSKLFKVKVTLKKVNGKYLKSKKVTLKFNGKSYKAKTNKKGVATFKIYKKAIKKLKVGKKYKYKAIYLKETVNKKITIKK